MKYLAWFGAVLAALLAIVYLIVFTSFGNGILGPILEKEIQNQTRLESKLSTFHLSMSDLNIVLELDENNIVSLSGEFSLFSQTLDLSYTIVLDELANLSTLAQMSIQGSFDTNGTIKGDFDFILVEGISDLARSDTAYKIELAALKPQTVLASIKGAKLEKLLYMLGQPNLASSDFNMDLKLTSLDPENLAGYADVILSNGVVNSELMEKHYALSIPKTTFKSQTHLDLKGKDIDYTLDFISNLASLNSRGNFVPQNMAMDLVYDLNVKELALLKPITGADVRGPLNIDAKVKGDKKSLTIDGKSDFASSETTFVAKLQDFQPASLKASMKNLKLQNVLYMFNQPHYADGVLNLEVNIPNAKMGELKGEIVSSITNGLVDSKYLTKAYEFETAMPSTTFKATTNTKLEGDRADTKIELDSTLASLSIKKARFNIKDGSLVSDYMTKIPSLEKLFFVTARHMNGGITASGELKKDENLELNIHSNVAGGKVDAKLYNDDFTATLNSLQTLDLLHILIYPEIFKSSLDGKLSYNLVRKKGTFKGNLVDGKFTKSQMLDLVKQYAKVDLYVEKFAGDLKADINKENIVASLDLKSNTSSITSKDAKLNSKTKQIDSTITVVANKSPLTVTLRGDVTSPKVGVDMEKLMKSKTGEVIEKEVGKLLKNLF